MEQQQIIRLVYLVASLIILLPTAAYVLRQKTALRNLTIWVALVAALMWGYHVVVEKPQLDAMPASSTPDEAPAPPADSHEPAVRQL